MTHITSIAATATGYEFTTDINAGHTFDVYDDDGELMLSEQTGGTFEITTTAPTPPRVFIDYYQDYLVPYKLGAVVASNNTVLQWMSTGADGYHVEQYDGAQWLSIAVVSGNDMYLQYTHRAAASLAPNTQWRITPCSGDTLDGVAATGPPVQFSVVQVGLPDVPRVVLTLAGGDLTVSRPAETTVLGGVDDGL